jgi:2,4-dienoyl-CoA reductase-like NADH-dependent reductase (Old Yellow Enzyme family)
MMDPLFQSSKIGRLTLKNRFIRSATWEGLADDEGGVTPELIQFYSRLAEGGAGLIITGHCFVHPSGRHAPRQLGLDQDSLITGYEELTRAVHGRGGKIILQISMGGAYLSRRRVEILTGDDLSAIAQAFGKAAHRARTAGFDGVQILAAHGFLLSQFLCPRYNPRGDEYGGPIENRARLLLKVLSAIRRQAGPDYPVLVKLNSQDLVENGLTLEESLQVGLMLQNNGCDAIEVSGGLLNVAGLMDRKSDSETDTAAFRKEAIAFKKALHLPIILVGGIRSLRTAEDLMVSGAADYISMCRPFICEPDLIKRWENGDDRPAVCLSCNQCVEQIKEGFGPNCAPLKPDPPQTFFPEDLEQIPAGPPHPPGTSYQVVSGLEQRESGFFPVLKVQLVRDEKIISDGPSIPLNSDDPERVIAVIKALAEKHRQRS